MNGVKTLLDKIATYCCRYEGGDRYCKICEARLRHDHEALDHKDDCPIYTTGRALDDGSRDRELLVEAHNALLPLAKWTEPCEPSAADCILACEITQEIRRAVPMIPSPART